MADLESIISNFNNLSDYERQQADEVIEWKGQPPDLLNAAYNTVTRPVAWLATKAIPENVIKKAVDFGNYTGKLTAMTGDIKKNAGVDDVNELKSKNLELSDKLAKSVQKWAVGYAVASGAGTGLIGFTGFVIDIPALITLAMRTIYKIGACYGYIADTKEDWEFILCILIVSSVDTLREKEVILKILQKDNISNDSKAWNNVTKTFAKQFLGTEIVSLGLKGIIRQLSNKLAQKKFLSTLPIIGTTVGGGFNGWFINDVSLTAKRMYQEKWLIQKSYS